MAASALKKYLKAPPERTTVFKQIPSGLMYRIPSLIYIEDSRTLLAFAEERTSPSDDDAKVLVWREGKVLDDRSIEWSSLQKVHSARLPGHRTMNPCPVYDKSSKTVFLFFICVLAEVSEQHQIKTRRNAARLCCVTRKEGEPGWGPVNDLTESVIGEELTQWATFAVGPGHGIQLAGGKLVVPAYKYCVTSKHPQCARPYAFYFYSTDCGGTWHLSQTVPGESCECQMAEVLDCACRSRLYCNARHINSYRRVEAWGESGKVGFKEFYVASRLVQPRFGCQGSVVSIPVPESHGDEHDSECSRTWLLFSHPSETQGRFDLGLYLNKSPFQRSTWEHPWVINHGPSGYSDLAYCADSGIIYCLLECGESREMEQIALLSFSLEDVLEAIEEKA